MDKDIVDIITGAATLFNAGLYWKLMERITRIEASQAERIVALETEQKNLKESHDELKDDVKQIKTMMHDVHISIVKQSKP